MIHVVPTLGFLGALLFTSASTAGQLEWRTYDNAAFGYEIDIPLGVFSLASEENGITLLEDGGLGQIAIYGASNSSGLTPREFEEAVSAADRIREITYAQRGESWFAISGYYHGDQSEGGDLIFYTKFMFSRDGKLLSAFEVTYPTSDKIKYDPVIEHMEATLTAPAE